MEAKACVATPGLVAMLHVVALVKSKWLGLPLPSPNQPLSLPGHGVGVGDHGDQAAASSAAHGSAWGGDLAHRTTGGRPNGQAEAAD